MKKIILSLMALLIGSVFCFAETDYIAMKEIRAISEGKKALKTPVFSGTVKIDTINENTTANGVVVETVTIKDGDVTTVDDVIVGDDLVVTDDVSVTGTVTVVETVSAEQLTSTDDGLITDDLIVGGDLTVTGTVNIADGAAATPSLATGSSHGLYEASGAQLGVSVAGALSGYFDAAGIDVGQIDEIVGGVGVLIDGVTVKDGAATTTSRMITSNGTGTTNTPVSAQLEYGIGTIHQTILTFSVAGVALADGDHGVGTNIYTFPEGVIKIHGVTIDSDVTNSAAFNASDDDHFYVAVGTVSAADDNDLTGTEANLIAKIDEDTAAGVTTTHAEDTFLASTVIIDGSSTACGAYLNFAVEASDNSDANTFGWSGTITITWTNLGDY